MTKQSNKHIEAFEYYYSLGTKRSNQLVADKFCVTKRTADEWSRKNNWVNKVKERDLNVSERLNTESIDNTFKIKKEYVKQVKTTIDKWFNEFSSGRISFKNISDLEKLVNLYLKLTGEDTSNCENCIYKSRTQQPIFIYKDEETKIKQKLWDQY